jgi:hypothetical protein
MFGSNWQMRMIIGQVNAKLNFEPVELEGFTP